MECTEMIKTDYVSSPMSYEKVAPSGGEVK